MMCFAVSRWLQTLSLCMLLWRNLQTSLIIKYVHSQISMKICCVHWIDIFWISCRGGFGGMLLCLSYIINRFWCIPYMSVDCRSDRCPIEATSLETVKCICVMLVEGDIVWNRIVKHSEWYYAFRMIWCIQNDVDHSERSSKSDLESEHSKSLN